jgi:hypothetical protein
MEMWNKYWYDGEKEQGTDFFGQNMKISFVGKINHSLSNGNK